MNGQINQIPSLTDAASKYAVNRINAVEGVRQSLYDFQLYPTAGATLFTFFALPQGQGLSSHQGNASQVKGIWDTNMEAAGQLPRPKCFLMESIEIRFDPGSVSTANTFTSVSPVFFAAVAATTNAGFITDMNLLQQVGTLNLYIGSKFYLQESPLGRFPPKARPVVSAGVASNSATTAALVVGNAYWDGRPYFMSPPIFLESTQNFSVTLTFPTAIATPSGFNARIGVILDGFLYRNSQ